jgi:hypothetical protein
VRNVRIDLDSNVPGDLMDAIVRECSRNILHICVLTLAARDPNCDFFGLIANAQFSSNYCRKEHNNACWLRDSIFRGSRQARIDSQRSHSIASAWVDLRSWRIKTCDREANHERSKAGR